MNEEITNEVNKLKAQVKYMTTYTPNAASPYESIEVNELYQALAKAQLDMSVAKTDSVNPFFKSKYADLTDLVKASRPSLSKFGLCVIQRVLPDEKNQLCLFTRLCHASGQWMESRMPILPPKQDIQAIGSYITYLRRYNYSSITGVVADDEDDDGEVAMRSTRTQERIEVMKPSTSISQEQLKLISNELEGFEDILDDLLSGYNITKLSSLPEKNFVKCLERIREIRRAKEIN